MKPGVFVGFGFGALQAGLFIYEAFRSGKFSRLVVAEIRPDLVGAVRRAGGCYRVNVATRSGLDVHEVAGVEVFNPQDPRDRPLLVAAVAEATELCTALPSVAGYDTGSNPVAPLLAEGLRGKTEPCVVYAAENTNHAAALLERSIRAHLDVIPRSFQAVDTVIGKMSGERVQADLAPITDELPQAFLVEEFNRILISRISLPGFARGLAVFEEKADVRPFEEAKLYGHNAVHAALAFLARRRGYQVLSEAGQDAQLMAWARAAFLEESGPALIARHQGKDDLFTPPGIESYAEDLLERMTNPWLSDAVARVIRDPRRKLGWNDRLIGTMRLALDAGVTPHRFARGAAAALETLPAHTADLDTFWPEPDQPPGRKQALKDLIRSVGHAGHSQIRP